MGEFWVGVVVGVIGVIVAVVGYGWWAGRQCDVGGQDDDGWFV